MKFMNILITGSILACFSLTSTADESTAGADCKMLAKNMSAHALTMIQGGASLQQTLGMFGQMPAAQAIVKEIYSHKDDIDNPQAAAELGMKVCQRIGHG